MQPPLRRPRQAWSAEQKLEAIAVAAEHGRAHASRVTGVPAGTIASWLNRAGIHAADPEQRRTNIEQARMAWSERRAVLGDQVAAVADKGLRRLVELIETDQSLTVAELLRVIERLLDKARSLHNDSEAASVVAGAAGVGGAGGGVVSMEGMLAEAQQRAAQLVAVNS